MKAESGAASPRQVVVDTNVLISAALRPDGTPARLVRRVLRECCLVFSARTFADLESRLWKPKFDRYVSLDMRQRLLHDFSASACWVEVPEALSLRRFSRDVDNDAFIHAALAAGAGLLVTGDEDLLCLHPLESLQILSPQAALAIAMCPARR